MSLTLLTTTQYDETKFKATTSVVLNRVEGISLMRSMFAGLGALFGGKNTLIQEAIDRLQARGWADFKAKVQQTEPNATQVIALKTDISEVGRDENATFMVMTISGTCLVPISSASNNRAPTTPVPTNNNRTRKNKNRAQTMPLEPMSQ